MILWMTQYAKESTFIVQMENILSLAVMGPLLVKNVILGNMQNQQTQVVAKIVLLEDITMSLLPHTILV